MLKLFIKFDEPVNLFGFILFALVATLWTWFEFQRHRWRRVLLPFIAINLAALAYWALSTNLDEDETELLHSTWMYTRGMTPYVDFWQHHLPMIWVFTAPIVRWIGPSPAIYVATRFVATVLAVAIGWLGWRVARRIWGREASLATYALLFLAGAGFWEFARLRADLPMVLLLMAGLLSALRMADGRRWGAFWSGFFIALGLTFTVKHYLTMLLPAAVIFVDGQRDHVRRLLLWAAGGVLGALPLAYFVLHHHVLREFLHWVLRFNSGETVADASVPFGLLVTAIIAVALIVRRRSELGERGEPPRPVHLSILIAFAMASWTSLFAVPQAFGYYLNYWMVLTAALGAGISLPRMWGEPGLAGANGPAVAGGVATARAATSRRAAISRLAVSPRVIATGLLLVILTAPNLFFANTGRVSRLRGELTRMRLLLNVAGEGTVFMFNPEHPIFVGDATRLYTRWQLRFVDDARDRALFETPGGPRFVDRLIAARPAIIARDIDGFDLAMTLRSKQILDDADYDRYRAFLDENYALRRLGKYWVYVANERADRVPAPGAGGTGKNSRRPD